MITKKSDNEAKKTGKSKINSLLNNDNRKTNNSGNLLMENKMNSVFHKTNKKQHNSIIENKSEKYRIGQSQIVLPSNVLNRKNYASSEKQLGKNQFHSQISNKSEEYFHDTTEKNNSNKKLRNADKLGKNSKKNFIGKFCGLFFNNTDQQHLVKSIHHGEICTSGNRENKKNRIILGENKFRLAFNETSRKQRNSGRANTFKEDQVEQSPIILTFNVLKGKKYDASSEKHSEKSNFHS